VAVARFGTKHNAKKSGNLTSDLARVDLEMIDAIAGFVAELEH
jgi:hypothetical protein